MPETSSAYGRADSDDSLLVPHTARQENRLDYDTNLHPAVNVFQIFLGLQTLSSVTVVQPYELSHDPVSEVSVVQAEDYYADVEEFFAYSPAMKAEWSGEADTREGEFPAVEWDY